MVGLFCLLTFAWANGGSAQMTFFPAIAVGDGRTNVTVTVEVRDSTGRLVADGTQVLLTTTIGTINETIVTTRNGIARLTLLAPTQAGIAKVTASVPRLATNTTIDYEFVATAEELNQLQDFIQVSGPEKLLFASGDRIIMVSAPNRGARITYRNIEIQADDLQINVPQFEVRARNALVTISGKSTVFRELYYQLNRKAGYAVSTVDRPRPRIKPEWPVKVAVEKRQVVGVVELTGLQAAEYKLTTNPRWFEMADVAGLGVDVRAKSATVWPYRYIYFRQAEVTLEGRRLLRLPLLKMGTQPNAPLLGEQVMSITNSQVALSYPYYLSLKPESSSLLRLRSGLKSSTGAGATGGNFIDLEHRWNKGANNDGSLLLRGISRGDWSAGLQQYLRLNDKLTVNFLLDSPAHSSLFANLQVAQQFRKSSLNYTLTNNRSLKGFAFGSATHQLALDNIPEVLGKSGINYTLGLTALHFDSRSGGQSRSSSNVGVRGRFYTNSLRLAKGTSMNSAVAITHRLARNQSQGTAFQWTTSVYQLLGRFGTLQAGYDFLEDPISSSFNTGRHRVNASATWDQGRFSLGLYGGKTLDARRYNLTGRVGYVLSSAWRFQAVHSLDRFTDSYFGETSLIISRPIQGIEVGVSYSSRTRRLGLELLGAGF
ncbi:MAG: hypothetical protein JNJ45_02510 [Chthonomonas sp.]|nr:hypothetical protein [Chthonomonas sp.]